MTAEFSDMVYGLIDSHANRKYIAELEIQGGRVFRFPAPDVQPDFNRKAIKIAINNLKGFDWVIFPDVYAVEIFFEILDENDVDPFELDEVTVCAFGEAVADRLRFVQVHSDIIPAKLDDATIIETIRGYVVSDSELSRLRVLCLAGNHSNTGFVNVLRNEVEEIVVLHIYRSELLRSTETAKLSTLLKGGAIDEFVFCSAEDVQNLLAFLYPQKLETILGDTEFVAADSISFQALREHSLNPRMKVT